MNAKDFMALLVMLPAMRKRGMAQKIITVVIAAVVGFFVLSALLPTFLEAIGVLNATIVENGKITGASGLGSLLYLLPFLLIIGAIVGAVMYFSHKKGWGG